MMDNNILMDEYIYDYLEIFSYNIVHLENTPSNGRLLSLISTSAKAKLLMIA